MGPAVGGRRAVIEGIGGTVFPLLHALFKNAVFLPESFCFLFPLHKTQIGGDLLILAHADPSFLLCVFHIKRALAPMTGRKPKLRYTTRYPSIWAPVTAGRRLPYWAGRFNARFSACDLGVISGKPCFSSQILAPARTNRTFPFSAGSLKLSCAPLVSVTVFLLWFYFIHGPPDCQEVSRENSFGHSAPQKKFGFFLDNRDFLGIIGIAV